MLKRLISLSKTLATPFLWVVGVVFVVCILVIKLYLLFVSSSASVLPYFYMVILYLMLIAIYKFKISVKVFYKLATVSYLVGVVTFIVSVEFLKFFYFGLSFFREYISGMTSQIFILKHLKKIFHFRKSGRQGGRREWAIMQLILFGLGHSTLV